MISEGSAENSFVNQFESKGQPNLEQLSADKAAYQKLLEAIGYNSQEEGQ